MTQDSLVETSHVRPAATTPVRNAEDRIERRNAPDTATKAKAMCLFKKVEPRSRQRRRTTQRSRQQLNHLRIDEFVLNDAGTSLTQGHTEILHKGLSYIPSTNKPDPKDTRADLDRLRRSINLRIFCGLRDDPSNLQSQNIENLIGIHHNTSHTQHAGKKLREHSTPT